MSSPPMRQARRMSRTPAEGVGDSRRRSTSRSGIPMPNTGLRSSRITATQPTYDFLSGGSAAPSPAVKPLGQSLRQSQNHRQSIEPTIDNENFRAQIKALQYEVDSLKQQREYTELQHEKALRDAVVSANDDFRKSQAEESKKVVPVRRFEDLSTKFREAQDQLVNFQSAQDKDQRKLKEERRVAQQDAEEARNDLLNLERDYKQAVQDMESTRSAHDRETNDLRTTLQNANSVLETTKDHLSKKEAEAGELESENLRLRAQAGDGSTLEVIKKDLAEQVTHIRKLESANREQSNQLKSLRQKHKAVEIIEEEKRSLEVRLAATENLRKELREAQLQREILEDEKRSWTSYLQSENGSDQETEFKKPEDMARALAKERAENASTMERLGTLQSEIAEKDAALQTLGEEKTKLQADLERSKSNGAGQGSAPGKVLDSRARKAIERQRALALKEVEFLREQLKTFDSEEQTYHSEENQFDAAKTKRIADLEQQVDDHRRELANLASELSNIEAKVQVAPSSPLKRPREDDEDERLGQLARKNRKLQDSLSALQSTHGLLQTEHQAIQSQLTALQQHSKTRVLSLRSNPTSDFEALKVTTLETLKQENKDLLSQLESNGIAGKENGSGGSVPASTLDALRLEIEELERTVAEKEKRMLRLKQIWGSKSLEFREAVFSLLGWRMDFRPNGKFALSLQTGNHPDGEVDETPDETLIFDGENGTMKVAGGMDSAFAREVRPLTKEWVEQKRYIPGLMASVLLSKIGDGTVLI